MIKVSALTGSIEELKTIIKGLKMSGLAFIEYGAVDDIKSMIKALPSSEEIDRLSLNPNAIKNIQKDVGNLMRILEIYSKRDMEFKTIYKSRTGLPPRYKVLDWRSKMQQEAKDMVKELVRISSLADEKGQGEVAGKLIKCAKSIQNNENVDMDEIVTAIKSAGLEKEAALPQWMKDMGGAIKGIGQGVKQNVQEMGQVGKYSGRLQQITKMVDQVTQFLGETIQQITADMPKVTNPDRQAKMKNMLTKLQGFYTNEKQTSDAVKQEVISETQAEKAAPGATGAPAGVPTTPVNNNMVDMSKLPTNMQNMIRGHLNKQRPPVQTPVAAGA